MRLAILTPVLGLPIGVSVGFLAHDFTTTNPPATHGPTTSTTSARQESRPLEGGVVLNHELRFIPEKDLAFYKDAFAIRNKACQD